MEQLNAAIDRGDAPRVTQLLKNPQGLGSLDSQLVMAASKGQQDIVRQLLDAGAKLDSGAALLAAVKAGSLETTKLLLDSGADVNKQGSATVIRDLQLVSNNGQTTTTFQVQQLNGKGNNALSMAILCKNPAMIRLLLERGADKTLSIIYRDATALFQDQFQDSLLNISSADDIITLVKSGQEMEWSVRTRNGEVTFFFIHGGKFATNMRIDTFQDKSASMQELAKMSGDEEIIQLLSVSSK
jgi:ankyrin repeat protein